MKKQLVIVGIVVLLVCVGLSGCTYQLPVDDSSNKDDSSTVNVYVPSTEELESGPQNVTLTYYLHGQEYNFNYTVYWGLSNYLASLPRTMSYDTGSAPPTRKDFILRDLNNEYQFNYLLPLSQYIESLTTNKDDQARIAISIVQNIPYDWEGFNNSTLTGKYPYEVLYTQKGVCGEKSELLMFLLRDLGFGIVAFEFGESVHMAVGVKSPSEYCYDGTGYCFVETSQPSIITYSEGNYVGAGKLSSYSYDTIIISGGLALTDISEEYNDAKEYNRLNNLIAESPGGVISQHDYDTWWEITNKYGLQTS